MDCTFVYAPLVPIMRFSSGSQGVCVTRRRRVYNSEHALEFFLARSSRTRSMLLAQDTAVRKNDFRLSYFPKAEWIHEISDYGGTQKEYTKGIGHVAMRLWPP